MVYRESVVSSSEEVPVVLLESTIRRFYTEYWCPYTYGRINNINNSSLFSVQDGCEFTSSNRFPYCITLKEISVL